MSRRSPFEVQLCAVDRAILEDRASSRTAPYSHGLVLRTLAVIAARSQAVGSYRSPESSWQGRAQPVPEVQLPRFGQPPVPG